VLPHPYRVKNYYAVISKSRITEVVPEPVPPVKAIEITSPFVTATSAAVVVFS